MRAVGCFLVLSLLLVSCGHQTTETGFGGVPAITDYSKTLPLERIKLPPGFIIKVFAEVNDARSLAVSPSGLVFVGNKNGDKVYAVQDVDGDHVADKRWVVADGLNMPNGVAYHDGDLFIAEVSRIIRIDEVEKHLGTAANLTVVNDQYPTETHHGWKYIAFGPDGKLYVPVGAPCNICESDDSIYASITRMKPDGTNREIFAHGVRNSVGFTWHPTSHDLWFTDNGRDMLGDDIPSCELNHATAKGQHFGYPYCHQGDLPDPDFGSRHDCSKYVGPADRLGPHVAPLGLKFYTGIQFPDRYRDQLIIARHGSWNRSTKIGYDVCTVSLKGDSVLGHQVFATGWLDDVKQQAWGRPVDILVLNDGSILVSDDGAGVIYRIEYQKP